jgi:hypothetical protein
MHPAAVLDFVNLFCAGILAGALFIIDYGVGRAVAAVLDEQSQIQVRQALIRSRRVLVPAIFIPTLLLGVTITVEDGFDPGFGFRCAHLLLAHAHRRRSHQRSRAHLAAQRAPKELADVGQSVGATRSGSYLGGGHGVCALLQANWYVQ